MPRSKDDRPGDAAEPRQHAEGARQVGEDEFRGIFERSHLGMSITQPSGEAQDIRHRDAEEPHLEAERARHTLTGRECLLAGGHEFAGIGPQLHGGVAPFLQGGFTQLGRPR